MDLRARRSAADRQPAATTRMPRWVKVFLVTAALILVVAVAAMMIAGGQHGPGRHLTGSARTAAHAPDPATPQPIQHQW